MNIQLDYPNKTIRLASNVSLKDFVEWCQKHIEDLNQWQLETNTTVTWANPIVIEKHIYPDYTPYWYNQPVFGGTSENFDPLMFNAGVHNLSIQL